MPAPNNSLEVNIPPVEDSILEGFRRQYCKVFDTKAVLTMSTDKVLTLRNQYGKKSKDETEAIPFPYAFLMYQSFNEVDNRYAASVTARHGLPIGMIQDDNNRVFSVKFLPKDFVFSVEYVTNSAVQAVRYAKALDFAQRLNKLSFSVAYAKTTFDISCTIDISGIAFPTRDAELENIQEYTVTHNLTVHGYLSEASLVELQTTDKILVQGQVSPEGTVAFEDTIINQPGTSVWSLTPP